MSEANKRSDSLFSTPGSDPESFADFDPGLHYAGTSSHVLHLNAEDIDTGAALQQVLAQYVSRIRQLKEGLHSSHKENDHVVDDYLMQNLELISLNKNLELKVKERTRELEVANSKLELINSSLQNANQQLEEQAQKLKELGETKEALMHMIVHDMKNPLTAILGTLSLFSKNTFELKPEIHELLLHSRGHGIKLLSMIEEILMISRMQTKEFRLKPVQANLAAILFDCIELMKPASGPKEIVFRFSPPAMLPTLMVDVAIIERVINNLLNNAIKYAPKGSEVLLEAECKTDRLQVRITNWGDPIPHEYHDKIFELFSRVNQKDSQFSGTGLGLTFTKLAVEAHGGAIKVISPVPPLDFGVCFVFCLPLGPLDLPQTSPGPAAS